MKRGVFVVLDGNDGSGKATQARLLKEYLENKAIAAEMFEFPAYESNFFGAFIGECLAGKHGDFLHMDPKIVSTLYAADRQESSTKITEALVAGKVVIADRFTSSNQIHQGGKIPDSAEREAFLMWLDTMEHEIMKVPRPDAIIYLRVPVEVSLALLSNKRSAKNGGLKDGELDMVEEDRTYLERSHEAANWLLTHQSNWSVIECMRENTMRSREDIHAEVVARLPTLIPAS